MPSAARMFGKLIPIPIPAELSDESTLLAHLGLSPRELKKIWWYRSRMYRPFQIAKGTGKSRIITAPDQRLKILQSKLARLLNQLYRVRNPVHGFVPERSVKTNAAAHGSRRFVVNLDLQEFFPTITENRVHGLLCSLGVDKRVAEIISRICCFDCHLPQGAPSSPVISNMVCYRLDTELLRIAKGARAIYTRYADDITFSSYQPPAPLFDGAIPNVGRFSPDLLAAHLRECFKTNGFTIHPEKTHYADRNSRRLVTGVKINAGLNVDRRYIRIIRAQLHSIEMSKLIAAQERYEEEGGKGSLEAHLRGKISYIAHLKGPTDPVVRSLAVRFNRIFNKNPIKLLPTEEEQRDRSVWIIEHSTDSVERCSQGTAFFLKEVGLVTAAHCVKDVKEAVVYHPSKPSNQRSVTVSKRCDHRDLAILDHTISENEYFEVVAASRKVSVGDAVMAYGYPGYGAGDKINIRPGSVTSLPTKSAVDLVEVDQILAQGMSGGPIVDTHGEVIGIVHKGGLKEDRQVAIHLHVLQDWLKEK